MSFFDKMIEVAKSMGVKNFAYYKKWALDHLKKQLDEDKQVTKAIEYCEEYLEKAYGVGTIRTWKGKKYIKGPDKKWRRYYDKHERGTSIAISHIMKQINALEDGDVEGLYAIIQKNAGRFRDQNGNVLPEVQQIHDLVEKKQSGSGSKKEEVEEEKIKGLFGRKYTYKQAMEEIESGIRYLKELRTMTGKPLRGKLGKDSESEIEHLLKEIKPEDRGRLEEMFNEYKEFNKTGKKDSTKEPEETEQEKHDNRSNAMMGNDNAKKDFEGTDLETVAEKYASDKDIKNLEKKISETDFTIKDDPTKPFMSGVYNEDGYKIATDGRFLAMIKADYPKEDEGKIKGNADQMKYIGKKIENLKSSLPEIESKLKKAAEEKGTGSKWYEVVKQDLDDTKKEIADLEEQVKTGNVNATFPNYKKVIPSMGNAKLIQQEGFEDFDKVLKTAMIAAAYRKQTKSYFPVFIRVGNKVYDAERLSKVMAMAKKHGLNEIVTTEGEGRCVEFKGDNGSIVIMPMARADEVRDNEFNANTGEVKIEDKEKAEEFLSGGEKETSITFAKNKTKYEKKFDKDVIDIMNHFHKQKGMKEVSYGYDSYLRAAKMPDPIKNENNEDYTNAMNDLKSLYHDYQGFVADVYNRRYAEEGKANKDISSKEIKTFFEDGIKKIKDKYGIKKSFSEQIEEIMQKSDPEQGEKKHDLEYYKKWALSILAKQKEEPEETVDEPNEETVVKALIYTEIIAKAGYPVGTIREWKGKKYIKVAPNQWKPKYDNMGSRGAKMSLTNLKKAVAKCNSEEELFNLINSNASRFRDENGRPFPEVQELHDMLNKRQDEISNNENGNGAVEDGNNGTPAENKEPGKNGEQKKTSYADKISAIQNAGNKGKAEVEKLSHGNVEGVAEDAGDSAANGIKENVKKQKVDVNSGNTDNTDNEPEENENTVTDSQTTEKVISDYLGDKKPNETRQREGNKETIWGNDYTKNHKLEFKQNLAGVLLGKPQMDQELFEELSKYDINNDSYLLAPKYGLEGAEFLNLLSKIKDNRVNIVDSGKEMDEEEMSNQAEQDQDSRVGSSALWDQNVKNAIKTGDVDKIKSAIAKVEKEYEVLSKRAKTPDEKEFLSYELKFRKRDAENALKELQNK